LTAIELIDSIFRRPQSGTVGTAAMGGMTGEVRRITRDQLYYLRHLIEVDEDGNAIHRGAPGSLIWCPRGRNKYVVAEDLVGEKHTLTQLPTLTTSAMGRLF